MNVELSVVIPVFNEEGLLETLHESLTPVLQSLGKSYEIVFVDDGSSDRSWDILQSLHAGDRRVKTIRLARNFGHQIALGAGLDYATGEAVIVMDADLQDPPDVIPQLVHQWEKGCDVVYTIRERTPAGWLKRTTSAAFYVLFRTMTGLDLQRGAGDFRLMSRKAIDAVRTSKERYLFLRGFITWMGFAQDCVHYQRGRRVKGESKYSWRKMIRLALEGIFTFSSVPLRCATYLGLFSAVSGFLYAGYVVYARLVWGVALRGWASQLFTILILGGLQLLILGVIGEYLRRIYEEVKGRPTYLIRECLGFDTDRSPETERHDLLRFR